MFYKLPKENPNKIRALCCTHHVNCHDLHITDKENKDVIKLYCDVTRGTEVSSRAETTPAS